MISLMRYFQKSSKKGLTFPLYPTIILIVRWPTRLTNELNGGIAQLGERLNGIQEVSGSIPLISTKALIFSKISAFFHIPFSL